MLKRTLPWIVGAATTLSMAVPALAGGLDDVNNPTGTGKFGDLGQAINTIFTFVIGLAGIIFVILFLVGGIQYLTSAGDAEAVKKAKALLINAIIGLVIVLSAWAVGNFVLDRLGLTVRTQQGAEFVS